MKFSFVLLIALACGVAQAQQPAPCLELRKVTIAHHVLHRQGQTEAKLKFRARNCYVVQSQEQPSATFESKPDLDVAVNSIGFRDFDQTSVGTSGVKARELSLSLRLAASPALPTGEHNLRAMLSYRAARADGTITAETLAFDIPFKVAPAKLPDLNKEPSAFVSWLQGVGWAVVVIPVYLVMLIPCLITGDCPSC
jgi:hypothetical protein